MQPTSWEDALDLVALMTPAVVNDEGEDGLIVSAFHHGGAGGGHENTWGTGKFNSGAMKVKSIRIHNRPACNTEVHGSRHVGVGEPNNAHCDRLNATPRKCLGFRTPAEVFRRMLSAGRPASR